MADRALTERMKEHFQKQITCYEAMLHDLSTVDQDLQERDLQKLVVREAEHRAQTEELDREFRRLLQDWHTSLDVSDAERAEVRVLALQAGELADRLAKLNEHAHDLANGRLERVRAEMNELRRGREFLKKYGRRGKTHGASFIDRKI